MILARHLALACIELAERQQPDSPRVERYRRAEVRLRALADLEGLENGDDGWVLTAQPVVKVTAKEEWTLVDFLGGLWGWNKIPDRIIDRDLVEASKELLEGLAWQFPR